MSKLDIRKQYTQMTVSSGVRSSGARAPEKIALVCGSSKITYRQLISNMNKVANFLQSLGIGKGDNIAIISRNCIEYIEIVLGGSDTGGAVATPNPRLSSGELEQILNDCAAKVVFVDSDVYEKIKSIQFPFVRRIVEIGQEYESLKYNASSIYEIPYIDEWQTYSIPYTSGTTGKPKGVMLPHRSRSIGCLAYSAEYGIYSPSDYFLAFAPLCHGAGLTYAIAAIFVGGTTEIIEKFEPEVILRKVHSGAVTGMFTVPTHYHSIFELENKILNDLKGNKLNGIIANAAPLPHFLKEKIIDYFGDNLLNETYGSTEAGIVTNLRPEDQLRKINCVGQPFVGNKVKILDENGDPVSTGSIGELYSLSPFMFTGYLGQPEKTEETFKDGWVSVGDMARMDDEGYIYIVDRKNDMIISGGVNIYPKEIEIVIGSHDNIKEVAVIGVPDDKWGESIVAYVVLKDKGITFSEDEIKRYCESRIAKYKIPGRIYLIDSLPKNSIGKVVKSELKIC